jgi:hypothetical protein
MKRGFQLLAVVPIALVIAGVAAPKFRADEYRGRIQNAMEKGLGRRVTLGEVRYNLLTGPGFTVSDVSIGEDPALGAEPIAYVAQLEATPRLWSLFTGHLEFSSLRLEDAHLNLSRNQPEPGQYRWNFEQLLRPSIIATFPNISIRGSRINFEVDHVKSVVYLLDSDLDVTPPTSSRETWKIRFEGKPARTDRPARGSGSFTARGEWKPSNGVLDLDLQLDRSEVGDVVALIRGENIGLQGTVTGKAHLAGPPSALTIHGRLTVAELHGWDQSVPQGETWPLALSGSWNVSGQQLKLDANAAGKVTVHYRVEKYLTTPRWAVSLTFRDFSVVPLVALAKNLGIPMPDGLKITGQLEAALGYSGKLEGQATLRKTSVNLPGAQPVQMEKAEVVITQGHAVMQPTRVAFGSGDEADLSASYTIGDAIPQFTVASAGMDVRGVAGIPLLAGLKSGRWNGRLKFDAKQWSGSFSLLAAEWAYAGFSEPVRIESAEGRIDGARVTLQRIRARVGRIAAQGEYRYEPGTLRPHRFRIGMADVDASELERIATPALTRKNGLFGFGKSIAPDWLTELAADGTLEIRTVHVGTHSETLDLQNFRSRVLWDGVHLALPNARAEWRDGQVSSRVLIDLTAKAPAYELYTKWTGIDWKGGKVDADTVIQTSGVGTALVSRARSTGTFSAHSVLEDYETATGRFDLRWAAIAPQLTFTELKLGSGADIVSGRASLQDDGALLVDVANSARQMRVAFK